MATHHPMVSDQRKKYVYHHSNFKTPFSGLSMISQAQFPQVKHKNISSSKTAAELKLVREWRSMNTKNMGNKPSCSNVDDEFLETQPFVEEPVSFNFGDDYGNHLFLDLQKELSYERENYMLSRGGRGIVVGDIKYTRDDICILSTEEDMIDSFLKDNLL